MLCGTVLSNTCSPEWLLETKYKSTNMHHTDYLDDKILNIKNDLIFPKENYLEKI